MAKAIHLVRFGESAKAFEFREVPDAPLAPNEVRIAVKASGLNFADVMARLGIYPDAPALPFVPGYEVSGTIDALGSEVKNLLIGQRVLAFTHFGGYATHVVVPDTQLALIPDSLGFAEATALGTQGVTAWIAAEHLVRLQAGDHVLIHAAAGGVGSMLVQLAKKQGCIVYGTASTPEKQEYLRTLGVDHVLPSRDGTFAKRVQTLRGDKKLDVIFDSIGGETTRQGLQLLAGGGRIVCYGVADMATPNKKSLLKAANSLLRFGLIHPVQLISTSRSFLALNVLRVAEDRPALVHYAMRECVRLSNEGVLKPHVGGCFPASEIGRAQDFLGGRGSLGKVVIEW